MTLSETSHHSPSRLASLDARAETGSRSRCAVSLDFSAAAIDHSSASVRRSGSGRSCWTYCVTSSQNCDEVRLQCWAGAPELVGNRVDPCSVPVLSGLADSEIEDNSCFASGSSSAQMLSSRDCPRCRNPGANVDEFGRIRAAQLPGLSAHSTSLPLEVPVHVIHLSVPSLSAASHCTAVHPNPLLP